jgi:hypothetical protein
MSKRILLVATVAVALVGSSSRTSAQEGPSRSGSSEVGRYQLVRVSENHFFLIDTATGHCWSRTPDADWRDEGNPTKSRDRKLAKASERSVPKLDLPGESVEMVVMQREERSIPGSDGSVRIRLGDITDGQVLLSVGTDDEDKLLERTSVAQGDTVWFSVGKQKYTVHVEELRNILIGDDFAKITVALAREEDTPKVPRPRGQEM